MEKELGSRQERPNGSGTWHRGKGARGAGKKGRTDQGRGIVEKELGSRQERPNGSGTWHRGKGAREQARKAERTRGIVEKELMNERVAEDMTEERKEVRWAPMAKEEWCWPRRITRWRERVDPRPEFHNRAEDDERVSGGLNHLLPRHAGGPQWTWQKVTVVVNSGAAEDVMPRSVFPEIGIRQTEVQERKRVQRTRRREHGEFSAASCVCQNS